MPHNSVTPASESAGNVEMTDKHDDSMDVAAPLEIKTESKESTDAAQPASEMTEEMNTVESQGADAADCVAGDESSSMIAVDENGRIIATGAEAERLIAAHQAMQEQQLQQEQQQDQQDQDQQQPAPSATAAAGEESQQQQEQTQAAQNMVNDEDQLFQSATDQQMMEAATGEPASDSLENSAGASAQPTDILQQAFEASGADTAAEAEGASANAPAELTPGELVEQAVAQVHGSDVVPADAATEGATVVAKVEQQENTPPLGSCDNPIQIIQQGNTYHSTQTLSQEQLQQIAHVLQQQQVAKAIKNGGSAVVFNPATNTRIIYRVIYPNGAERKDKAATPNRITKTTKIVKQHPKGYKGRGRPAKRFDDDINPEGSSMSKEEREVLKKQVPRTRSGRISRPPSYMVRDYKRIHHLDFHEEPPPDNSDGGYSDIDIEVGEDGVKRKRRKLVLGTDLSLTGKPKRYRCPQCDHAYISSIRLSKHFRDRQHGDPDNIPPPVNVEDFVETEVEEDDEEVKKKEEEQKEKRKQMVRRSYVDMVSSRKKNRLRDALRQCNDKEILDVCLHRVAKASTMWQMLLAKSEEGDPPKPDVSTMLVHLETLLQQTEKLGKNFLVPADGKQEDSEDMVELIDEMVAAALGNRKPGMYRVLPEAYDPELDFLVKPNYLTRPRDVVRKSPIKAQIIHRPKEVVRSVIMTGTSRTATPNSSSNVIVNNRPTPVALTKSTSHPIMQPPNIVRRVGNTRSYVPNASNVTMTPQKFTPAIISAPRMQFKVVTTTPPRPTARPGTSLLKNSNPHRSGGSITRVTPQSVRGTTMLTPPSVTPAQHIQQQIHAGSSSAVTVLHHQQHQQQLQQQHQQMLQQQQQQQQQISHTEADAEQEHEEVSLVVGEVYEDENGQPVVINEDGTITPVSVQHVEAPAEQQHAAEQDVKLEPDDPQEFANTEPFIAQERSSESGLLKKALESVFASESLGFSSDSDSVGGQEDETLLQEGAALEQAIMQGEETTTATVTAVIGEGDAAVALALTTDANGDVVKQIMLTDGQVLGTCTSNGELSLSDGVNLLQQEDGSAALQFIQGNIQVPLETVRALFTMEQQSAAQEG